MPRLEPYSPTPAGRFGRVFMMATPFVLGLICVLLSFVPMGRILGTSLMPAFAFMAIYYWAVVRPEMFPASAVFVVGLLSDLLSGGPIGLWVFVYLASYWAILSQRFLVMNTAFSVFWFGFLLACLFAGMLAWIVACILFGTFVPLKPVLWHMLMTVALFPLFAGLFGRIQRRVNPLS
jgi:rod shape-determining protein MreD